MSPRPFIEIQALCVCVRVPTPMFVWAADAVKIPQHVKLNLGAERTKENYNRMKQEKAEK